MDDIPREKQTGLDDRRVAERRPFLGKVLLEFGQLELAGPARNVSATGIHFVAEGQPEVLVRIEGQSEPRRAELIRVEALGSGLYGVAVRFLDVD